MMPEDLDTPLPLGDCEQCGAPWVLCICLPEPKTQADRELARAMRAGGIELHEAERLARERTK